MTVRRTALASVLFVAAAVAAVAGALFLPGAFTSRAVQTPNISLDMVTTGTTYDGTTNTMTVGSIDNCLTSATAQTVTHIHGTHLVVQNVEDLVGWQVRLNYIGDKMRPLNQNIVPFTDSATGQGVGFTNLPIDPALSLHRDTTAASSIPPGAAGAQTALVGGTYNGSQTAPISPDTPAKATPDDASYSAPSGGVISALNLQVVGNQSGQTLNMDLDDGSPNPPGSSVVVFNGVGITTNNLTESALHDGAHVEGGTTCGVSSVTPTATATAGASATATATRTATATATTAATASPTATATRTATATPTAAAGTGTATATATRTATATPTAGAGTGTATATATRTATATPTAGAGTGTPTATATPTAGAGTGTATATASPTATATATAGAGTGTATATATATRTASPVATPTRTATATPTAGAPTPTRTATATPQPGGETCDGLPATKVGTEGRDMIVGTGERDVIVAKGGNDIILGRDGNDVICAGSGNDLVIGGNGNDRIFGQGGNDLLFGGRGDDFLDGGSGSDICVGGPGQDTFANCERRAIPDDDDDEGDREDDD